MAKVVKKLADTCRYCLECKPANQKEKLRSHDTASRDGVIYKGERIFIPEGHRQFIKKKLHASHNMPETMMKRATETVYWPGMAKEVKKTR